MRTEIKDLEYAVEEFAEAMKERLRSKANLGWAGWRGMDRESLGERLLMNAAQSAINGDRKSLVDVANLAMMIHRSNGIKESKP